MANRTFKPQFSAVLLPIRWLLSVLFLGLFLPYAFLVTVVIMLPLSLFSRALAWRVGALAWRISGLLHFVLLGTRYHIRGRQHIPRGACLVAVRHESQWETMQIGLCLPRPVWVLKGSLTRIFGFRTFLRHIGCIALDRSQPLQSLQQVKRSSAARLAEEDCQIVIFPNGTRVGCDDFAAPLRRGIVAVYESNNVPVVPVALTTSGAWPRMFRAAGYGAMIMEFHAAIPAGLPREEFMQRLHDVLNQESKRLRSEVLASLGR